MLFKNMTRYFVLMFLVAVFRSIRADCQSCGNFVERFLYVDIFTTTCKLKLCNFKKNRKKCCLFCILRWVFGILLPSRISNNWVSQQSLQPFLKGENIPHVFYCFWKINGGILISPKPGVVSCLRLVLFSEFSTFYKRDRVEVLISNFQRGSHIRTGSYIMW